MRCTTLALVFVIAFTGRAFAQNAEAEGMFDEGDRLFSAGKIAEACDAFEASNRIEQRAGTLIRLGECREQNHQYASAWSAYKDALTRVRDPRKREIAEAKAKSLEPRLSYLTVSVPDESRVDGLEIARNGQKLDPIVWNRAVPVDGGQYVIVGRAPGHEEWQSTAVVKDENDHVSVDVPKFKEIAKLIAPAPVVHVAAADDGERPLAPPSLFTLRRKIALGAAGAGAVGFIVGIVVGVSANHDRDSAYALCPDPQMPCANADRAQALLVSGHGLAIEADVALGVGAAAVVAAGVLWFTGAPEHPHRIAVVPSASGMTLVGRF